MNSLIKSRSIDIRQWSVQQALFCDMSRKPRKILLSHINNIQWYQTDHYLVLDDIAKRNLELFSTLQDDKKEGSLFHLLDQTITAMGAGVSGVAFLSAGIAGQNYWKDWPRIGDQRASPHPGNLRKILHRVYDLERLGARIAMGWPMPGT